MLNKAPVATVCGNTVLPLVLLCCYILNHVTQNNETPAHLPRASNPANGNNGSWLKGAQLFALKYL